MVRQVKGDTPVLQRGCSGDAEEGEGGLGVAGVGVSLLWGRMAVDR